MRLLPVALLLLCVSAPVPVLADALAPPRPRGTNPSQLEPEPPRRTGRVPARIAVAPPAAAPAPPHVIITIPRDVLRDVMATPRAGAGIAPFDDDGAGGSDRLRHLVAAGLLTLAVLSLPLLLGMRRRGRAAALVVVAVLAGVALVRADIAAPGPRPSRPLPAPTPAQTAGPQTVEVIIVSGKGPVQVQLMYPPRP
jgi:hypothetical protein